MFYFMQIPKYLYIRNDIIQFILFSIKYIIMLIIFESLDYLFICFRLLNAATIGVSWKLAGNTSGCT